MGLRIVEPWMKVQKQFLLYRSRVGQSAALKFDFSAMFLLGCLAIIIALSGHCAFAFGQSRTPLSSGTALYARVLRLSHNSVSSKNGTIVASVTAFPNGNTEEDIYASSDGVSFSQIGAVTDADFSGGLCCGTLYELPSQVGALAPGTLLWAGSVGQSSASKPMQLKIYQSADQGKTWSYLSSCATATKLASIGGGLWEPQFAVANDGALVCFYSDETQAGHSQLIHQVRSYDGINWQDSTFTIASTIQSDRPGMVVTTLLPSGLYFMSYELCGAAGCTVFSRTSSDGWNWGDATNMGTKVATATGQYFEHAPTNAWAPSATSAKGTILLIGQIMFESSGAVSSGNGKTIFTNHSADGSGAWSTMASPVQVPTAYDNYCPNYSSPLLPSTDGISVLEFASDYVGATCTMYYGSGAVIAGVETPAVTVTPAAHSITTAQSVAVTITVAGPANDPAPTGTVTLTSGSYTSNAASLSNGSASITIPANTLAAGSEPLTASYSGDANYVSASGSGSIAVTAAISPSFAVSGGALTVTAGATTGNTSTITVTPAGGFTGSVVLTAQIASGPANVQSYPTLSFGATSPVSITGASAGSAVLTVSTVAASGSALARPSASSGPWAPLGATALSSVLLIGIPRRRRRLHSMLVLLGFTVLLAAGALGCGGASSSGGTITKTTGTTPGVYVVTVTGASGSTVASNTLTLTVQ
jgi:hypothetical protein